MEGEQVAKKITQTEVAVVSWTRSLQGLLAVTPNINPWFWIIYEGGLVSPLPLFVTSLDDSRPNESASGSVWACYLEFCVSTCNYHNVTQSDRFQFKNMDIGPENVCYIIPVWCVSHIFLALLIHMIFLKGPPVKRSKKVPTQLDCFADMPLFPPIDNYVYVEKKNLAKSIL